MEKTRALPIEKWYRILWEKRIPQFFFYAGLFIELVNVIIDKRNYTNPIEGQLFRVTFLIFLVKVLLSRHSKKDWAIILCMEVVGLISYRVTGKNDVIRIVTFVAACSGISM